MNSNSNHNETIIKKPNWWHRRSQLEKAFIVLIAALLIIILALLVVIDYINEHASPNICTTPACLSEASKLAASLDESVDPCDDFHEFVCGNFIKNTRIPNDKASINRIDDITELISEQLRDMLNDVNDTAIKPFKMVKDYYESCKNTTAIDRNGLKAIKLIIKSQLGGWPVLDHNWNDQDFDWTRLIYKFRRLGFNFNGIINVDVDIDLNDATKYSLFLDQPSLGLEREFLVKGKSDPLVKAYYDYMVDIAEIFGANREKALKDLDESLEFEMSLANISLPDEERRDINRMNNVFTIQELQQNFTKIQWFQYINDIIAAKSVTLKENDTVIVGEPKYFRELEVLLEQTPKKTQSNYLIWRVIKPLAIYLNDEVLNRRLQFQSAQTGQTERNPRWKECLNGAFDMNLATAALFIRNYFGDDARQNAKEIVSEIRSAFKERIRYVDWMDEATRQVALEKVNAIIEHIGFPDEFLDDQKLIDFYQDLEINPKNYFLSALNMSRFSYKNQFAKLQRPVNKTDWRDHGEMYSVNAFYNPSENSIYLPAAILQGAFFGNDRPRYMNFGGISFVIGHEIMHGFDDQGSLYDKNGNLVDWWPAQAKETFKEKAQCFIEQYGNYTVPEVNLNLNGFNTQGENIADNGGIQVAYFAYNKWVSKFGIEKMLPGLNYTPNQLFWISSANVWCSKERINEIRQIVETDHHSYGKFRVIGSLSNNEQFAEDFNCPVGSKMNPEKKCSIW